MFPSDLSVEGWLSHLCDLVPGTHTVYLRRAGSKCYDLYQPGAPPMSFETPTAHLMPWVMVKSYTSDTRAIERWARAGRRKSFDDVLSSIHLGRVECMLDVFTGFHENQAAIVASEEALVVWGDDHQSALALLLQVHRQLGGLDVDVLSPVVVPASLNNSPLARHAALSPRAVVNSPMLGDMPAGFEHDFLGLRPSPEPDFGSSPSSSSTSVITPSPLSSGTDLESVLYTPYNEPFTVFPSPRPHEYGPLLDHTTVLSEDYIGMSYDPVKHSNMGFYPQFFSSFEDSTAGRWTPDLEHIGPLVQDDTAIARSAGASRPDAPPATVPTVPSPPIATERECCNPEDIVPEARRSVDESSQDVEMRSATVIPDDPMPALVRRSARLAVPAAPRSAPTHKVTAARAPRKSTRAAAKKPAPRAPTTTAQRPMRGLPARKASAVRKQPSPPVTPQASSSRVTLPHAAHVASIDDDDDDEYVERECGDGDGDDADPDYEVDDNGDDDDDDDDDDDGSGEFGARTSAPGKGTKRGRGPASSSSSRAAKRQRILCRIGCTIGEFDRTHDRNRHEKYCPNLTSEWRHKWRCGRCQGIYSRRDACQRHNRLMGCRGIPHEVMVKVKETEETKETKGKKEKKKSKKGRKGKKGKKGTDGDESEPESDSQEHEIVLDLHDDEDIPRAADEDADEMDEDADVQQ